MHGMRPFGDLVSKEEALERLLGAATPIGRARELPLSDARGRVASETVRAPFDVPSFDRAMMDGYALRAADAEEAGARLRVVGEVFAGQSELPSVGEGEAARIATGAPMPPGADAVVRVEETEEADGHVTLGQAVRIGQSVDLRGSDLSKDAVVVRAGQVLTPARLGLLASVGCTVASVLRRPRVALFASGDELLRPGEQPRAGAIFDSNTTALGALMAQAGAVVDPMPALRDELQRVQAALKEAAKDHELIVLTGGASVGARDVVGEALQREGELLFHGVRIKPGKPILAGRVGEALVVGLPGNPTSALSNTYLFVMPALQKIGGQPLALPVAVMAELGEDVAGEPDRFLFLPVKLEHGKAVPTFKGSGALTSMASSDGWIGVPEGATLRAGESVEVQLW